MTTTLKAQLREEITAATRSQDKIRLSALRMLLAAVTNREKEVRHDLSDDEVREVAGKELRKHAESIEAFEKAGRQELADKELAEIAVLQTYLPPAADAAVVERAVAEAIAETGATSPKDMGAVMKAAMARLAGQSVDGKIVSELVKKTLAAR